MSKVDEDINNQVSDVPPKKQKHRKTRKQKKLRLSQQVEVLTLAAARGSPFRKMNLLLNSSSTSYLNGLLR